jgi:mannose-6-phosphate isomerase-like protein (cupin superfamily)
VISTRRSVYSIEPVEGLSWIYVPKNAPHQFLNVGKSSYDVVVVMLK